MDSTTATVWSTSTNGTTTSGDNSGTDAIIGFVCCILSGSLIGSMFVPLKGKEMRDGFYVMLMQSGAAMVEGFIVNCIRDFPKFQPLVFFGGFLFATGNTVALPIVNTIGVGLGLLLRGSAQILIGWATARFGWFGLKAQIPKSDALQIIGVVLSLISAVLFAMVHNSVQLQLRKMSRSFSRLISPRASKLGTEKSPLLQPKPLSPSEVEAVRTRYESIQPLTEEQLSLWQKMIRFLKENKAKGLAILMAVGSGLIYGEMFTPMSYVQQQEGASLNGLDYVYSFNTGILCCAMFYFALYGCIKRNQPFINPQTTVPGIAYGIIWAVAMTCWFVSQGKLSQAISLPINTRLPGVVGALWQVFYYKDIRGVRDLGLLCCAMTIALLGVVLIGLSK